MSMVSAQLLLLLCSLTDRPTELLALRSEMDDKETEASECNKQLQQVVLSAPHADASSWQYLKEAHFLIRRLPHSLPARCSADTLSDAHP